MFNREQNGGAATTTSEGTLGRLEKAEGEAARANALRGNFASKEKGGPYEDIDFRKVLQTGLLKAKTNLMLVAFFSFCASLLILSVPIYLFQISDRVLTSRSLDTLVMLTAIVIGLIFAHVLLDMLRRFLLMRVAVDVETRLGGPVLSAAARASHNGSSQEFQALSDLQQIRGFITGPVLLTMMDAPVAPIYLFAVFLVHLSLKYRHRHLARCGQYRRSRR